MKMTDEKTKETEIVITNETNAIAVYKVNYEDVKNYLATELKKYDNLLVTEEYIQMAKKSRAELNAMKKDLQARLSEVRNAQLKPYNDLKANYTDALEKMIDEQLVKIDNAIKEIEQKKAEEKQKEITEYFNQANAKAELNIEIRQLFNPKWTNQTYSMNKIKGEIDAFFQRVKADIEVIESFDDEFVIPLKNIYLKCFDMSAVMRNKVEFDNEKKKRIEAEQEAERLRKELEEKKKAEAEKTEVLENLNTGYCVIPSDDLEDDLTGVEEIPEANTPEDIKTLQETSPALANETQKAVQLERIEFWVEVTPEQKLLMRNFVLDNHIKCGKIVR
jgi:hypothetical protein